MSKLYDFMPEQEIPTPIPISPDPKGRYLEYYQSNLLEKLTGLDKIDYLAKFGMVKALQFRLNDWNFEPDFDEEEEELFYQKEYVVHQGLKDLFPESVGRCCTYWKVKHHECGNLVAKPAVYCGDKHHCPVCARGRANEQGTAWVHRLLGTGANEFLMLTFTVPDWLSYEIVTRFEGDRKKIRELMLARVRSVMDTMYPDLIGYYPVVHEWSSKDPLSAPHLHVHVVFPCIKRVNGKLVKFRGFQHNQEKFERFKNELRREWTMAHGETISFVVHFQYCSRMNYRKLKHMVKYVVRRPVLDINRWMLKESPQTLTEHQLEMLAWLTDDAGGMRLRAYRELSNSKINALLVECNTSLAEVKQEVKKEVEHSKRCFCPYCKKEIPSHFWKNAEIFYSERPPPYRVLRLRDWRMYEEVGG